MPFGHPRSGTKGWDWLPYRPPNSGAFWTLDWRLLLMILLPLICLNHVESVLNRFTSICIVKGLGTQEAICGSEVVSFCLMYFHGTCIEFLRRLMKPITQRSLQAAQIFSDAHGKEAKSVSGSLQFSVKIGGFWMILSDQVPRAPTCTDIPIYRINMIAKIFWLNQIQVVWSNLDCFIDRLPASTNRGAAGHTDSTAAAACSSGARWNPGIWWFLRIFAPLLIEWRGSWWFKEGQSESWNGSTQPPLKPNDPRWGPWQVRHKRHLFDGWFWLVGQPDELHPETAWAYAYHCFNAEETSSYSHTSHIVSTKVVGNTGEIIGQCCWFARADSYLPQICNMNLSQWISPP